jgi:hypothetical protein
MIAFIFPSLTPNISGKNFLGALFIPKMLLETGAPPPPHDFFMLPTPLMVVIVCAGHKGIKY